MQQRTHIWIFNQFICTRACAWSSNFNYAYKVPRKPSYCIKMSKRTPKNSKYNTTLSLFYVDTRNFFKAIRGNEYRFVPKGGTFPTKNHLACCEKLRFVRSIYPNLPQMEPNLYHAMLMPLHDSMPSFMNFRRVLDLLEFKNQVSQRFAGNQQCPGVWISFTFLAWDLEIHPRTHMWFWNQP